MTPAPDHSATEHDRIREAVADIREDIREMRASQDTFRDLLAEVKDVAFGKWSELHARMAGYDTRLGLVEKAQEGKQKTSMERANLVINTVLVALVMWLLYKVTGIKMP